MSDDRQRGGAVDQAGEHLSTGGRLVAADGRTLPLRGVGLRAQARGGLARVLLEQRFVNTYPEALRVSYQVPLPADGAVAGFAFRVGDRRVVGEVDRLEAARERFESALLEGRTAALLEQTRANLFSQEIGNIPAGVEVVAQIEIDQRLAWLDEGAWEWRFPMVVAPRYLGAEGRVADAQAVTVDVAETGVAAGAAVALTIRDLVPGAEGMVTSPSHGLGLAPSTGGVQVTLAGEPIALDRDVVVRWPAAAAAPGLTLGVGRPAAGRPTAEAAYGLLTVVPPTPGGGVSTVPRDLIVLLDTSGSMDGAPLAQAKQVARALVGSLDEADQLELIEFSSKPRRWRRRPASATATLRQDALDWIDGLKAAGGTEMRAAVVEALQPLRSDARRQVVLITDGQIGFESEIVGTLARDLPAGSSVHTVGVGSSVNRALTAAAARAGRGVEVVIGLDEEPGPHVARLLARMRAPVLTDLKVSGSALIDHAPAVVPDVHMGAPLRLALKLRPEGGTLLVRGQTPAGPWEGQHDVGAIAAGEGDPAVVCMFGRETVEDLEVQGAAGTAAVDPDIERLGLEFQIATRLTSWVAVSEEPAVDPTQAVRRERMPHALAHGLSVEGLGLRPGAMPRFAVASWFVEASDSAPRTMMDEREEAFLAWVADEVSPRRVGGLGRERPASRRPLTGRLVLRRDGELTFEIDLDTQADWRPEHATIVWRRGGPRVGEIVTERTTAPGTVAARLTLRLTVRLDADVPNDDPDRVIVTMAGGSLEFVVRRA